MEKMNDELPIFYPVKGKTELMVLIGYTVENVTEIENENENRTIVMALMRELPGGTIKHREFMITAVGNRYITDEY